MGLFSDECEGFGAERICDPTCGPLRQTSLAAVLGMACGRDTGGEVGAHIRDSPSSWELEGSSPGVTELTENWAQNLGHPIFIFNPRAEEASSKQLGSAQSLFIYFNLNFLQ